MTSPGACNLQNLFKIYDIQHVFDGLSIRAIDRQSRSSTVGTILRFDVTMKIALPPGYERWTTILVVVIARLIRDLRLISLGCLICAISLPAVGQDLGSNSGSIRGRALDDQDKPLGRVVIEAIRRGPGAAYSVAAKDVTTDDGRYHIGGLPAGQYYVRALGGTRPLSAPPSCESCCAPQMDLKTAFYQSSTDVGHAKPVAVQAGRDSSGIDIQLTRVPVYCVRGEVQDAKGGLVPGAGIALELWDTGFEGPTRSAGVFNQGGRFLLRNLPEGSYKLKVTDGKPFGSVLITETIKVERANKDRVHLVLPAWAELPSVPQAEPETQQRVVAAAAPKPTPRVEAPKAPATAPRGTAVSSAAPSSGRYWQVISTSQSQADVICSSLKKRGLKSIVAPAPKPGYFRVLVGPLSDGADAAKTRTELEAAGYKNPITQKY